MNYSHLRQMRFKFDCVFYYVADLERAARFYTDVLGLKLLSQDDVARFDIDGVLFELVPTTDRSKLLGGGNARLCLCVDDMDKALEELKTKGVLTSRAQAKGTGVLASFQDLDGNEICLWEYRRT